MQHQQRQYNCPCLFLLPISPHERAVRCTCGLYDILCQQRNIPVHGDEGRIGHCRCRCRSRSNLTQTSRRRRRTPTPQKAPMNSQIKSWEGGWIAAAALPLCRSAALALPLPLPIQLDPNLATTPTDADAAKGTYQQPDQVLGRRSDTAY